MNPVTNAAPTLPPSGGPGVIAIDGPAASGKSTVGFALAARLNYLFFDTGAMYRVVTWAGLDAGVDLHDPAAIGLLAETLDIAILPAGEAQDDRHLTVLVDGQDVTWAIRSPLVDQNVSIVAAMPRVRAALSQHQRQIGVRYARGHAGMAGIVMVGRDIGTVVLPDAPLKIYLDAPIVERAHRRFLELERRGKQTPFAQVLADMRERDRIDSQRAIAPLRPADDAQIISTAGLSVQEIVARIVALAEMDTQPATPYPL
ncbi:MAG: (d)CMP kinase [Caldilineaceae bacterium]|nr:(d)CMP kinase [Caldilineaceae bacterium]